MRRLVINDYDVYRHERAELYLDDGTAASEYVQISSRSVSDVQRSDVTAVVKTDMSVIFA